MDVIHIIDAIPAIKPRLMHPHYWQRLLTTTQPVDDMLNDLMARGFTPADLVIFCGQAWAKKFAKDNYYCGVFRVWSIDLNTLVVTPKLDQMGCPIKINTGSCIYYSMWMN
jgi:hypothetical protein